MAFIQVVYSYQNPLQSEPSETLWSKVFGVQQLGHAERSAKVSQRQTNSFFISHCRRGKFRRPRFESLLRTGLQKNFNLLRPVKKKNFTGFCCTTSHIAHRTSHFALRTAHFTLRDVRIELDEQGKVQLMGVKDRPKREPALPKKFRDALDTVTSMLTPTKKTESSSHTVERSGSDSQVEILNSSDHHQLFPESASPASSPSLVNEFWAVLHEQKNTNRELQAQIKELKSSKTKVTDELKVELRQFGAELQQTLRTKIELEVERKVSEKVAPLQKELSVVKAEMQQLRERLESSPPSTSQQQTQPDVSKLEDKVDRLQQAAVQQAARTDQAARQLRVKNVVLRNFPQAKNETPTSLKTAVGQLVCKDRMQTDAVVTKATRFENKREGDVSPGLVIVEFANVADKRKVFKARGKLAGCNVGLDDDLTPLQQKTEVCCMGQVQGS